MLSDSCLLVSLPLWESPLSVDWTCDLNMGKAVCVTPRVMLLSLSCQQTHSGAILPCWL